MRTSRHTHIRSPRQSTSMHKHKHIRSPRQTSIGTRRMSSVIWGPGLPGGTSSSSFSLCHPCPLPGVLSNETICVLMCNVIKGVQQQQHRDTETQRRMGTHEHVGTHVSLRCQTASLAKGSIVAAAHSRVIFCWRLALLQGEHTRHHARTTAGI